MWTADVVAFRCLNKPAARQTLLHIEDTVLLATVSNLQLLNLNKFKICLMVI